MAELEHLLQLKQQNLTDDNLLSQLAFYYLANPDGDKDLYYFKKSYEINPSIKNTHNYAFWAYHEYGEYELALDLFQELMTKNPKSFYPYMAYASVLLGSTHSASGFKFLKSKVNQLICLYQKALNHFSDAPKFYQDTHHEKLAWIYSNLANVYLLNNDFDNAKLYYQSALKTLEICFKRSSIKASRAELDEYRYFILYNLLILSKLQNNKTDYQAVLTQLKNCESFYKYDVYFLKRKSPNNLKRLVRYFYKCWLFGCESCGNLADDS